MAHAIGSWPWGIPEGPYLFIPILGPNTLLDAASTPVDIASDPLYHYDNSSVRDKVYSPFSTIKARGLGLGIPIAKRTVIDHNGQIDIDTSAGGTTVSIVLPALEEQE